MEQLSDATFWIALGKIVWVNILLSGDNAVVIALAARGLPESQRNKAVLFGSAAAIVLRVVLTLFAVELLHYPYLKLIGAALLFWIGVQLLVPEGDHEGGTKTASNLWTAVRTILIADLVMSLDNVIAVAAAAESGPPAARTLLLVIGLGLSIPLIIFGSQVLMKVMERFPVIIVLGAALLGFVAGEMLVHDQSVEGFFIGLGGATTTIVEVAGAVGVVLVGKWLASRRNAATAAHAAAQPRAAVVATPAGLQRVLLAVDGSEGALKAVQHLIGLREDLRDRESLDVHLLSVQRPLSGDVNRFLSGQTLDDYHRERSEEALAPARAALDAAGLAHHDHSRVGEPGPTIAEVCREQACDMIVMGARGVGAASAALLGSVAQSAIEHATVPVLVVK